MSHYSWLTTSQGSQITSDRDWDGTGIETVTQALRDISKVWFDFLRPNEIPQSVPRAMRQAISGTISEEQRIAITRQICDGLIERLTAKPMH